jgi:hypothetical protein
MSDFWRATLAGLAFVSVATCAFAAALSVLS